jgi:putative RNA 2'-phosphotransferase
MNPHWVRISKFLSLVLRHQPEKIGLALDPEGWADVDDLLLKAQQAGVPVTLEILEAVVENNDKQRFAWSADRRRIRAQQGHSIEVDLGLDPVTPPDVLFHGTAEGAVDSIRSQGLVAGKRQHVHLSPDEETAVRVGTRHGRPVVLKVLTGRMHRDGFAFYRSGNGVWLTEVVPAKYLEIAGNPGAGG